MTSGEFPGSYRLDVDPLHSPTVLTYGLFPAISLVESRTVDHAQGVYRSARARGNNNKLVTLTFVNNAHFGRNSLVHAVITPQDEQGRLILGFNSGNLTKDYDEVTDYLQDHLAYSLQADVTVVYC